MSRYGLSKSKITAFEQCPKRLWLSVHRPHEAVIAVATQAIFDTGHEVGAVACDLLPKGIMIEAEPDLSAALDMTGVVMASADKRPVFEATFRSNGVLVRVDIMEPADGRAWHVAEVKSTTKAKEYQIRDLATQVWVLQESGVEVASAAIRHIDNGFVLKQPGHYGGLFADAELFAHLSPIIAERPQVARQAIATLEGPEPAVDMGEQCSNPFSCPFDDYCRRSQPQPTWPISLLPRTGNKIAAEWAGRGVLELTDLPEDAMKNPLHVRIYRATRDGIPYHNVAGAQDACRNWIYPRIWLDFETISFAVPRWIGTRPYEAIPFQFSAHIESENGSIEHREFLSLDGADPRTACAEALVDMIPESGTIIAYNASFERRCIQLLAAAAPQFAEELRAMAARVVDLLPVAQQHWYHPDQRGSWSIKAVLPTVGGRPYESLEIQDGSAAQRFYLEAVSPGTTRERREEIARELRAYCALDTEAMIHLYHHLCGHSSAAGSSPA